MREPADKLMSGTNSIKPNGKNLPYIGQFGLVLVILLLNLSGIYWDFVGPFIMGMVPAAILLTPIVWAYTKTKQGTLKRKFFFQSGFLLYFVGFFVFIGAFIDPYFSQYFPGKSSQFQTAQANTKLELWDLNRKKIIGKLPQNSRLVVVTSDDSFHLVRQPEKSAKWMFSGRKPPIHPGNYWVNEQQVDLHTGYARFTDWEFQILALGGGASILAGILLLFLAMPEIFSSKKQNPFLRKQISKQPPGRSNYHRPRKSYPKKQKTSEPSKNLAIKPNPVREDGFEENLNMDHSEFLENFPELKSEINELMDLLWTATPSSLKFLLQDATIRHQKITHMAKQAGWNLESSSQGYQIRALLMYNKGRYFAAQQRWGTATAIFQQVVEFTPYNPEMQKIISNAAFDGARACFELRVPDWDQTLRFFSRCQPEDLDNLKRPYYYNFLGEAYFNRGDWEKSEKCFAYHASIANAGVEMALIQQAKCLLNMGKLNEAHIVLLDERLHKNNDLKRIQCEANYLLGDVLSAQGHFEQAKVLYEIVMEVQPNFRDAGKKLQNLMNTYAPKDSGKSKITIAEQAIEKANCNHCGKRISGMMSVCPFCESEVISN